MIRCYHCGAKLTPEETEYYGYSCNTCEGYYTYYDDDQCGRPWNWLRRIWYFFRYFRG